MDSFVHGMMDGVRHFFYNNILDGLNTQSEIEIQQREDEIQRGIVSDLLPPLSPPFILFETSPIRGGVKRPKRFYQFKSEQTLRKEFHDKLCATTQTYVDHQLKQPTFSQRIEKLNLDEITLSKLSKRYQDPLLCTFFHVPVSLNGKWYEFDSLIQSVVKSNQAVHHPLRHYLRLVDPFLNIEFKIEQIGAGYSKCEEFEEDLKEIEANS